MATRIVPPAAAGGALALAPAEAGGALAATDCALLAVVATAGGDDRA